MKISYFGHSCFTISSGGFTAALDPYDKSVAGYPPLSLTANKVFCSHGHFDHNYVQAVGIVPADADPFKVTEIEIPHDKEGGTKRGMNIIRIFEAEGKKVIHFGDTGCMPSEDMIEALKGADAVLVPVGGVFTIDGAEAKELMEKIRPAAVIPMHYKNGSQGLQIIASLQDFLKICEGSGLNIVPMEYGQTIEI